LNSWTKWVLAFLVTIAASGPLAAKAEEPGAAMPAIQAKFIGQVCAALRARLDAANDLKKRLIAKDLDGQLRKLFEKARKIDKWVGEIGFLEVDSKGQAAVVINMPNLTDTSNCLIMLGNVEQKGLFNRRYFTTIKEGSALFRMLAEMEMGDSIRFSGEFVVDATGAPRHQEIDAFYVKIFSIEATLPIVQDEAEAGNGEPEDEDTEDKK
jgi:hypothetical protein